MVAESGDRETGDTHIQYDHLGGGGGEERGRGRKRRRRGEGERETHVGREGRGREREGEGEGEGVLGEREHKRRAEERKENGSYIILC